MGSGVDGGIERIGFTAGILTDRAGLGIGTLLELGIGLFPGLGIGSLFICFITLISEVLFGLKIGSLTFFSTATDGLVFTEPRLLLKVGVDVLAWSDRIGLKFVLTIDVLGELLTSFSVVIVDACVH